MGARRATCALKDHFPPEAPQPMEDDDDDENMDEDDDAEGDFE